MNPPPTPNDLPAIWPQVIADMHARNVKGTQQYGTPLQPFNGRDALQDAYDEALDLAVYLKQAIIERNAVAAILGEPAPFVPRFQCPKCEGGFAWNDRTIRSPDLVLCAKCPWKGPRTACGLAPPVTTEPDEPMQDHGTLPPTSGAYHKATEPGLRWSNAKGFHMPETARETSDIDAARERILATLGRFETHYPESSFNSGDIRTLVQGYQRLQSAAAERERQVAALAKAAKYLHRVTEAVARYGRPSEGGESVGNTATIIDGRRQVADALADLIPPDPSGTTERIDDDDERKR